MFETERLHLCRFHERHTDGVADLISNPEVARYIGTGRPREPDEASAQIQAINDRYDTSGVGQLAIEDRATGEFLGRVGFVIWDARCWLPHRPLLDLGSAARIELGWALRRKAWGQGYATEAAGCMRDFAFDRLGVHGLISLIHPENLRSRRTAERLGAEYEERVTTGRGVPHDVFRHHRQRRPLQSGSV